MKNTPDAAASSPPGRSSSSDDFSLFVGEHDRPHRSKGKGKERRQGERALPASRRSTLPLSPPRRHDRDDERQGVRTVESDTAGKVLRQARRAWARTSGPTLRSSSSSSSSPFPSSPFSSSKASSLSTAEEEAEAEMLVSASLVDLSTASSETVETEPVREVIDIVDDDPPLLPVPPSSRKRERENTGGRRGGAGDSGGGGISGRSGSEDEPVIETSSPCDGEDVVSFDAPANTGRGRTARASRVGRTRARQSGAAGQPSRGSSREPALEESEDEHITIESSRRQRRRLPNGVLSMVTSRTDGSTRSSGNGGGRVGSRTVSGNSARGASAARQRIPTSRRTDRLAARLQREETVRQEERDAEMARRLQSEEEINFADWGEGTSLEVVAAAAASRAATAAASSSQHVRRGSNRSEGGSIARGSFRLNGSRIVPSAIPLLASGSGSGGRSAGDWDVATIMNLVSETLSELSGGGSNGGSSSNISLVNRDLTSADYQELLALDEHSSSFNRAKGLSAAEMSMLPQQTGNGSGPVEQCCICMEDMTSMQKITRLPACLHTYHSKCIFRWLKGQNTCPIDKGVVNVREE